MRKQTKQSLAIAACVVGGLAAARPDDIARGARRVFYEAKGAYADIMHGATYHVQAVQDGKLVTLDIPKFNDLPTGHCSAYVRLLAEQMFGLHYAEAPAWERRYQDRLVHAIRPSESLRELAQQGILQPGMAVGLEYSRSSHRNDIDSTGKRVSYTHVGLCVGYDASGEPLISEEFGAQRITRTENDIRNAGLQPLEIIASRDFK